jgi:hypothetical protein
MVSTSGIGWSLNGLFKLRDIHSLIWVPIGSSRVIEECLLDRFVPVRNNNNNAFTW